MTGAELQTKRKALGLTQSEIADKLGISRITIIRWEKDEVDNDHPRFPIPQYITLALKQIEAEIKKK